MAELKTRLTSESVTAFLNAIPDEQRRKDCKAVAKIMERATGAKPKMWGDSIVGFGDFSYQGSSGKSTDWFIIGFAPRKEALTLYLLGGLSVSAKELATLGKHKTGKGCLYIRKLTDVNVDVLTAMIENSVTHMGSIAR